MHWTSCLIISFVGGAIVLLKNVYEKGKGSVDQPNIKEGEGNSSTQENQQPDILSLANSTSSNVHSKLRIQQGISNCLDYSSKPAHQSTITLLEPVYETTLTDKKYLIMHPKDFKTLQSICHSGAFGNDYKEIDADELPLYGLKGKGTYMALWKIPADLKKICNYVVDQDVEYTEVNVGTYALYSSYILLPVHSQKN